MEIVSGTEAPKGNRFTQRQEHSHSGGFFENPDIGAFDIGSRVATPQSIGFHRTEQHDNYHLVHRGSENALDHNDHKRASSNEMSPQPSFPQHALKKPRRNSTQGLHIDLIYGHDAATRQRLHRELQTPSTPGAQEQRCSTATPHRQIQLSAIDQQLSSPLQYESTQFRPAGIASSSSNPSQTYVVNNPQAVNLSDDDGESPSSATTPMMLKHRRRNFTNRTKTGCLTCRERKKKCDEGKPTCKNCERGGFPCKGYTQSNTVLIPTDLEQLSQSKAKENWSDQVTPICYAESSEAQPGPYYAIERIINNQDQTRPGSYDHPRSGIPLERNPYDTSVRSPSRNSTWLRRPENAQTAQLLSQYASVDTIQLLGLEDRRLPLLEHPGRPVPVEPQTAQLTSQYASGDTFQLLGLEGRRLPTLPSPRPPALMHPPHEHAADRQNPFDLHRMTVHSVLDQAHAPQRTSPNPLPRLEPRPISEREKMFMGLPYRHGDIQLQRDRQECFTAVQRFNQVCAQFGSSEIDERRRESFRRILVPFLNSNSPITTESGRMINSPASASSSLSMILAAPAALDNLSPSGRLGANVEVTGPFFCEYGYNIRIRDDVEIGANVRVMDAAMVEIGYRTIIESDVTITTKEPDYEGAIPAPGAKRLLRAKRILIGNDCHIGAGTVIHPGAIINNGAVIRPGTVVPSTAQQIAPSIPQPAPSGGPRSILPKPCTSGYELPSFAGR